MKQYLDLVREVLARGEEREDRTGVGTLSLFGPQVRYDLRDGFPLVTTKKVNFDLVKKELLWFLSGSTNVRALGDASSLWRPWADEFGNLGPIYGAQWRKWRVWDNVYNVDQIAEVIKSIKTNPTSRRHIVSAWNVSDLPDMALPPCHALFQFYVSNGLFLDCQLYQRSADLAVGVPFNVASYALLMSMIAQECSLTPRYFVHTFGDVHIYLNHEAGLREQLKREPKVLPELILTNKPTLEMTLEDINLTNYVCHPFIKFEVAV